MEIADARAGYNTHSPAAAGPHTSTHTVVTTTLKGTALGANHNHPVWQLRRGTYHTGPTHRAQQACVPKVCAQELHRTRKSVCPDLIERPCQRGLQTARK